MGIKFEKCLENAVKEKYGAVSKELEKVLAETRGGGASMQEALFHMGERIDSLMVKRAVAQLVNVYEQGEEASAGQPVKAIAGEMLSRQKALAKEFSGKLVVFSLLFIAVSAIIPAIFQSFTIVGSMFLKLSFSAAQILLIVAVGFPLLDVGILLYIRGKTPVFLRE